MIKAQKFSDLGRGELPWLSAHYHFSFSNYYNPERTGFGALKVINDDTIKPDSGFGMHPHKDMEIITYIRKGAISHKDNLGNEGRTKAGDLQVMSAGSGITHAEYNEEDEETTLFQIWITPDKKSVKPRWDTKIFPKEPAEKLHLLASGRKEDEDNKNALFIHQDAAIYGGRMKKGTKFTHNVKSPNVYALISEGDVKLGGAILNARDGAEITETSALDIEALTDSEIILIEVPEEN